MKILIITDAWHPQVNGVVRTYEYLRDELIQKGHDVKVIGPGNFRYTMPMPGYDEIKLTLWPYRTLARMIEAFAPDSIHIATEGPLGWAGRRYCQKHGIEFTSSYHTQFPDYVAKRFARYCPFSYGVAYRLTRCFIRRFHNPATVIMVATQSLIDDLKQMGFKNRMHIVSRGVQLDLFHPDGPGVFLDIKKPVALYVGRVAIEKNIEAFLDMNWAGTKIVVGDGPSMKDLSVRYPDVVFTGVKTGANLAAHYRSADVFVFPSRTDTFGIVIIEALASGLPVAGYNVMGPKDIITEDFLGVVGDDLSSAAKQALACGTPEQRAQYVKNHYTWDNAAQQFEEGTKICRGGLGTNKDETS